MLKPFGRLVLTAALAACASPAWAQKSTEIYIPIGQSPGMSGKHSLMGRIQSLNASDRSMTVSDASGTVTTVRPDARTQVWLDRSKLKQPNRKGDYADYRKDMVVEVKYRNNDRAAGAVEWVKVQAAE